MKARFKVVAASFLVVLCGSCSGQRITKLSGDVSGALWTRRSSEKLAAQIPKWKNGDPFELKGVKLKATKSEVEELLNVSCNQKKTDLGADFICSGFGSLADEKVFYFLAGFGEHVEHFSFSIESDKYDKMRGALEQKFGPSKRRAFVVSNRLNAKFENEQASWTFPDGVFTLEKYHSDLTSTGGSISSKEFEAIAEARMKGLAKESARDL